MIGEFVDFLKKYSVIGLAIAVIIGGKVNEFVSATVSDLLMPVVGAFLPGGDWKSWMLEVGSVRLGLGHWIGTAVDFVIVALLIFAIAKLVLREAAVAKK